MCYRYAIVQSVVGVPIRLWHFALGYLTLHLFLRYQTFLDSSGYPDTVE